MCFLLAANGISLRIGPTEEAVLKLPLLSHPCSAVFSMYVWMCAKGTILGAKSRRCMNSSPSYKLFIVTYPLGLEEDTMNAWVEREKGERQSKYWTSGSQHASPIPEANSLVVPIHVWGKGCSSRRWVGLLNRLQTSLRQASSSSCTSVVRWTGRTAAFLRAC